MKSANQGGVSLTELTGVSSGHGLRGGFGRSGDSSRFGEKVLDLGWGMLGLQCVPGSGMCRWAQERRLGSREIEDSRQG